jgi:UDP-N-acetylglucosamine 2-epimerase (non-hydrolysing)/GDP/UDP-N,N'-diacetylbacillosamine 2-epimerase (hydrolysing)
MSKRRIAIVTGSRAEYGLLYWPIRDLLGAHDLEPLLIVTGMHLSVEFGLTVRDIEQDGIPISAQVDMLVSSDKPSGIAKPMALGLIGFSDAVERLRPDAMLLLGDRFEIFAAAQAAMLHNVPLVHIAGGDTTEGAFDEAIRHAITKMAHIHLVTNEIARRRVVQMGEDPQHVHMVGSPGLDHLRRRPLLDRIALQASLGRPLGARNALITFHPVTLEPEDGIRQQDEMLAALDTLPDEWVLWFTLPNADTGGRSLAEALAVWAQERPRAHVFASLGQQRYLSLMREADVIVGNSSSGLYEAASFHVPTVNIGNRQRGRLAAASVLHCQSQRTDIRAAIACALTLDCSGVENPYGDGYSAARIVNALRTMPSADRLLKKAFHTIETVRV